MAKPLKELRSFKVSIRKSEDEGSRIVGYAARFNLWSVDLGGFREIIRPGAFADAIKESDIRALWNHNDDMVLGRNIANTLNVEEDSDGLPIEIFPPDTQAGRDAIVSIDRGDVTQMSFAFTVAKGGDRWWEDEDGYKREIIRYEKLYDVSPVTYPAYEDTRVSVRSLLESRGLTEQEKQALRGLFTQASDSDETTPAGGNDDSEEQNADDATRAGVRLDIMRRRVQLIEQF